MHNMEIYSLFVLSEVKGHPVNCFPALYLSFADFFGCSTLSGHWGREGSWRCRIACLESTSYNTSSASRSVELSISGVHDLKTEKVLHIVQQKKYYEPWFGSKFTMSTISIKAIYVSIAFVEGKMCFFFFTSCNTTGDHRRKRWYHHIYTYISSAVAPAGGAALSSTCGHLTHPPPQPLPAAVHEIDFAVITLASITHSLTHPLILFVTTEEKKIYIYK